MDIDRTNQILRVAKMYYMDHIPQNKIAEQEGISKPTVSRLIKRAHELGFIHISIEQPNTVLLSLERRIQKKYNLKKVRIFQSQPEDEPSGQTLSNVLLNDLTELIIQNTNIGITWNNTIEELFENLTQFRNPGRDNVKVIQLNGCSSPIISANNSTEFTLRVAELFGACPIQLCSLLCYENKKTARMIKNDDEIKRIFEYLKSCDIALYAPESLGFNKLLADDEVKMEEIESLKESGTVGFLCGHPVNKKGRISDSAFDQRIVALPLNDIRRIPEKFLVSTRESEADIVQVLCAGRLVTRLYITDEVAERINV